MRRRKTQTFPEMSHHETFYEMREMLREDAGMTIKESK